VSDEAAFAEALPGITRLVPEVRALAEAAARGDGAARRALAEHAAEIVGAFAALDLLQFVYVASVDEPAAGGAIDLIAPVEPSPDAVAWFAIDEVGYDEFRDAVTLFGDLADVLNPPIVLDAAEDDDEEEEAPAPSAAPPKGLY